LQIGQNRYAQLWGALQKLVQRIRGREDGPGRNRDDDGEKQQFDYKFPTLFVRQVASAQLTE
jgi:hypothetical protein